MMPKTMNLNGERKHNMKSILTAISLALALVTPAYAGVEWGFDTGANPASATVGSGTAAFTIGDLGTGWHSISGAPWSIYGAVPGASGLWDLGSAGSILLTPTSGSGLTTLNVFQWVQNAGANGPVYNGSLSVVVNSGVGQTVAGLLGYSAVGTPVNGAGWYDYTYNLGQALALGETVKITAGSSGGIIDRLTLVPEPATLIAGAVLLIPFALSTWPILRRRR